MEWSKLKNIILILLLTTNLLLLLLVGSQELSVVQNQSNARADALQLVEKNNISMSRDRLPRDITLPSFSISRDPEMEKEGLCALFGEVTPQPLGGSSFLYTSEKGEAQLRSRGEMLLQFLPHVYPIEEDPAVHAVKILSRFGIDAQVLDVEEMGDHHLVVYLVQTLDQIPIFPCTIQATYMDGSLTMISGTHLPGPLVQTQVQELSAVTGLLRFLELLGDTGDVCSTITTMTASYQMTTGLTTPAALTPVWYFETDTGSYLLNMTTSELQQIPNLSLSPSLKGSEEQIDS